MKLTLHLSLLTLLSSCSIVPSPNGYAAFMGGKRAFRATTTETVLVENNEKSFRDAAIAVVTGLAAHYSAATAAADEVTKQVTAREGTKQTAAKLAAETEQAAIAAETTKAITIPK